MTVFTSSERAFAEAVRRLAFCNPFLPERIEYERQALGDLFKGNEKVWCKTDDFEQMHPNIAGLVLRADTTIESARAKLAGGATASDGELKLYEDAVLFVLYHRYHQRFRDVIVEIASEHGKSHPFKFYREFERDLQSYLSVGSVNLAAHVDAPHLFACFFQLRRAFNYIFEYIIGASMPAAQLRASAWQSIFSHDMQRYRRGLYRRMGDFSSLIIGPSGTGKELVARAIAFSRYIAFNPATLTFAENFSTGFFPLNLSALSPTLIESELFGHRRGSFTGAIEDRVGWLEQCSQYGTVFLDEIGDVDAPIQVKLLRVLQVRRFQRIGERDERVFKGKLIAATNRDLARAIAAGEFREDFYYRLCADVVTTPSLREQLEDSPEALEGLVGFFARRLMGEEEAEKLAGEVMHFILSHLPKGYNWPGNVREVEQCVRAVLIHKSYEPMPTVRISADGELAEQISTGALTADDLLSAYCRIVYKSTGSYSETARRLGLDYRTVKSRVSSESAER